MMSYEETKEFVGYCKRFAKMFKFQICEAAAIVAPQTCGMSPKEYLMIFEDISDDMFAGAMMALALEDLDVAMQTLKDTVDGKISIDDMIIERLYK